MEKCKSYKRRKPMSTFVISDIHGEYEQLKTLLAKMILRRRTRRN